jgi:hypothetical protein
MSSITSSVKEIPNTSGTPKPAFDEGLRGLASDKPDAGIMRECIFDDGIPVIRGFRRNRGNYRGCSGSLSGHDSG